MLDTRVLVVEDENDLRRHVVRAVKRQIKCVDEAADGAQAQALFEQHSHPLVLLDLRLPGRMGGMEVLRHIKARHPASEVIILSAHGDKRAAVEALNLHAFRYLEKPARAEDIEAALREAYEQFARLGRTQASGGRVTDGLQDDEAGALDAEIRDLYARIAEMTARRKQAPDNDDLRIEHEALFQRLRQAQRTEAAQARAAFRTYLGLPRGQGHRSLQAAREELAYGTSEDSTQTTEALADANPETA